MEQWQVITEVALRAKANDWGSSGRHALFAAQERFREEGPDAFELHAPYLANAQSWDQISEPCRCDLYMQVGRHWLWAELEIRPGNTVIFRRGRLE